MIQVKKISKVSIIIPTTRRDVLPILLNSIISEVKRCSKEVEVLIVDDSKDLVTKEIVENYMKKFNKISTSLKYFHSGGRKFPSFCRNLGAKRAIGDLLIFIDDDNKLSGNVIETLSTFMDTHNLVGMAGVVNYTPDGKIWSVGGQAIESPYASRIGNIKNYHQDGIKLVDFIPNLYAVRKNLFNAIGGFDSKHFPHSFEEYDLSLRIWKSGYLVCIYVDQKIFSIHLVNDSQKKPMRPDRYYMRAKCRILFYSKHRKKLLYLKGIPDILGRSLVTLRYDISFKMKKKLISEYIKGVRDAFRILNEERNAN